MDRALANASTTAYTRFLLAKLGGVEECTIRVAHRRTEAAVAKSRVRIDGLSLKLSSCQTHCIANRHASGTMNRTRLGALRTACAAGAKEGKPGFMVPNCAGCTEAPAAATHRALAEDRELRR